ncbi:unnamed protein product [Ectocarpus sp. 6 AP-2014]
MLRFFKPTSTTGGGKGSRDVMDSSGGASSDVEVLSTGVAGGREGGTSAGSDAEVVATGVAGGGGGGAGASSDVEVLSTGVAGGREGGTGTGSDGEVVATGVVNGREGCEGASSEMDGAFSDAAHESGSTDMVRAQNPLRCAGLRPNVREPVIQHYPAALHGVVKKGLSWEARIDTNGVALFAVESVSRGILSPGCAGAVEEPGGMCEPCVDIKGSKVYRGETT